jgi:hypothetical protein
LRAAATLEDFKKLGCAGPGIVGVHVCCPFTTGVETIELLVEPRILATFLDHDHENRNIKTSSLSRMYYNDEKYETEKSGTTLRCSGCHRLKTHYHEEYGPNGKYEHVIDPKYGEEYAARRAARNAKKVSRIGV